MIFFWETLLVLAQLQRKCPVLVVLSQPVLQMVLMLLPLQHVYDTVQRLTHLFGI
jgi:hypothetical protein